MLKQLVILSIGLMPLSLNAGDSVVDSLERALHAQKDARERMITAMNIRDYVGGQNLESEADYLKRLETLFVLARDAKNESIKMEAIRRMHSMYIGFGCKKTPEAIVYKKYLDEMPNGYLKRASLASMEITSMILEYEKAPVQQLNKNAKQLLTDYFMGRYRDQSLYQKINTYAKILITFNRINASMIPPGLIKEFEEMAHNVPASFVFLRGRMFYIMGLAYQERRDARNALRIDSLSMENLSLTQTIYKNSHRVFPVLNTYSYYTFKYRFKNLVYNDQSLTREEKRKLAMETKKMLDHYAKSSRHLRNFLKNDPAVEAYYTVAMEDWEKTKPLLDRLELVYPNNIFLLEIKANVMKHVGTEEEYNQAVKDYQKRLDEYRDDSYTLLKEETDLFEGIARNIYELSKEYELMTKENNSLLRDKRNIYTVLILGLIMGVVYLFYSLTKITLQRRRLELDAKAKLEMMEKIEQDAKEKLDLSTKLVEEARLKNSILANMNHEIRTPLNAINGFTEILVKGEEEGIPYTPEERQEFYNIIHTSSERLLSVVSDIIDLSKLETNDFFFNNKYHRVNDLLVKIYEKYKAKNENPQLEVVYKPASDNVTLFTDASRFEQILNNLLDNALRFTPQGSVTLGCVVDYDKQMVNLYVQDTGIGISEDKLEAVFHRFVKSDDNSPGTGLGLAICKSLAERMGGGIQLESTLNVGSRFTVTLPFTEEPKGEHS